MKKVLSFVSSAVLALAVAFSASASQITLAPKDKAHTRENAVRKLTPRAASENTSKKRVIEAKTRTRSAFGDNSHFRKAATRKSVPVKVPFKAGARAEASMPEFLASVTYSMADRETGLYSIPASEGQEFELKVLGPDGNYGGVLVDGVYYTCDVMKMWGQVMGINYRGYDVETGEEVYNKEHQYYTVSMTCDPTTGKVYAIAVVEDMYALTELTFGDYEVEFNPFAVLDAGYLSAWNSIACAPDGQLYGICGNYELQDDDYECVGSTLYKIDKTDGNLTKVGDTGYDCAYMSDSTFDPASGKLYWVVASSSLVPFMAEVNTTTAALTPMVYYYDEDQIVGLVVQPAAAAGGAPAAAEDFEAKFENGSLSGTVDFTVPATTFDGEPATGNVTYTVKANGQEIASGTAACGEAVSVPVTLPDAGSYNIIVILTNAVGDSPAVSLNTYVGKDTPAAPEVTATYDSAASMITLSWTAVTGTVNGGYMDAGSVTYTVTRYPGATVVAEDITATTATDDVTGLGGKIFYTVEATADGLTSQPGQSNSILLMAAIVPPFMETFDSADALEPFTIINANGDTNYSGEPNTWHFYDSHVRVSYNSREDMDDWLISPAIKLEAGKTYDVVADFWANGTTFPERIEVKMGKSATIEGLTTVLLEPTLIGTTYVDPYKLSVPVTVDADGEYYIGFHGISDADMYALHLDNFGVTAPLSGGAPAAVENFTVTADAAGALSVNISFTAPAKAIDGSDLASLDKIVLSRGDEAVKTWENPAPGAELSYTDPVEEGGDYTYSVQAFNADGAGLTEEASAFVGFTLPAAPTAVTLEETANPGEVTVAWDAVTKDLNGLTLPASEVTYQVYKMEGYSRTPVSEKISDTSFTFQAVEAGKQDFVQYMVCAYDYAGESAVAYSPFKPVGTPYTTFSLTSEEDFNNYIIGVNETEGGEWYANNFKAIQGLKGDADGTGLLLYMVAYYIGDAATISSGKIDLSATENPGMVFYTYPFGEDDTNVITAYVTDTATGETTQIYTSTVAETGEPLTWNRINIDLSAYASKTVQLTIYACTNNYGYVLVDGWKVDSLYDYDLAVTGITAPDTVATGSDFDIAVTVANNGTHDADEFTVTLFADGEKLAEKTVEALASCKNTIVNFETSMDALASEPMEFYATVTYTADGNTENNTSETVEVAPKVSKLPRVTDLKADPAAAGVALSWSEPDLENVEPDPTLESFEDGNYGALEYEGWTFVDVDQSPVGTLFGSYEIPGVTWRQTKLAYVVLDGDKITLEAYQPHSGHMCIASIFNADYSAVDDWAISPELTGDAQTITFWAKSASGNYKDDIEMYYSTGSLEPADFQKVGETVKYVPAEWTQYSFEVPAGAKHFAVRSCSDDGDALLLDDFSFIPSGSTADLSILGYDIYRDGEKINAEPVGECEYTDTEASDGEHSYVVVTVYTTGISAPSNTATIEYDGIADATAAGIAITAGKGTITVTGAEGKLLTVAAADGKLYFNGAAAARQTVAAPAGIYVVKAGTKIAKVAVK